ncbi:MAG: amidohydrolase [Gemmatimonadetes bacterium]|nr:amidohydrolase [Gemmatimonadota bacterium]
MTIRRLLVGILLATGCDRSTPADLILTNARVYSLAWGEPDSAGRPAKDAPYGPQGWHPDAGAVAITDGLITFVGSVEEAARFRDSSTRVIDLGGATLVPGLIDSHTHVAELALNLARLDLIGVATEAEVVERVAARAQSVPKGEWIVGYGWDEGAWANRYPTHEALTRAVPDHPVFLRSLHGFAGWANRMALERAGIGAATVAPIGGSILTDRGGAPTGVVLNRAVTLLEAAIPAPTPDQLAERLAVALDTMAGRGYVAVHEAGTDAATLAAFERLEQTGRLPIRVSAMLSARDTALTREWLARGPLRDPTRRLRVAAVKAYYDGALGSRGARLLEDYADSAGHRGTSGENYGFDRAAVAALMRAGFQAAIHAIGDAGNREVLAFIDSVSKAAPGSRAGRHRIEHAQVVHPDDFARFRAAGVIASMEPPHAVEDMPWAEARLGPDRIGGAYAWRTMRRFGIPLILNSDLPGSDFDFYYGFHSAVTRRDRSGRPFEGWFPEQRLSPEEALRGYTSWAAFSSFDEAVTGIIAPGRWADLTALDVDPLAFGEREPVLLLRGKPVLTVVGGQVAFER